MLAVVCAACGDPSGIEEALDLEPEAVTLSASSLGTCAIAIDDVLYCWGRGDPEPSPVSSDLRVDAVSAGESHTCALAGDGRAFCWGGNGAGQLGIGSSAPAPGVHAVSGDHRFVRLGSGGSHNCAIVRSGSVYCWGGNHNGELGVGSADTCPQAKIVISCALTPIEATRLGRTTAISAGGGYTCALDSRSNLICAGWAAHGTVTSADELAFVKVVAGTYHACALTPAGAAYCWGSGSAGRLGGDADHTCFGSPCARKPVAVRGGLTFSDIAVGTAHTCALTTTGRAYCWGMNVFGQLGDGTHTSTDHPVAVDGGMTFVRITAGGYHTCAMTEEGAVYCWGYNMFGQLGAATGDSARPIRVETSIGFRTR